MIILEHNTIGIALAPDISGEQKKWHKITITFDGPQTSEDTEPNPFLDYRLNVTFAKREKQYIVPGYYAADGNAAEKSTKTRLLFPLLLCEINRYAARELPVFIGRFAYKF